MRPDAAFRVQPTVVVLLVDLEEIALLPLGGWHEVHILPGRESHSLWSHVEGSSPL